MIYDRCVGYEVELTARNIHKYEEARERAEKLLKAAKEYRRALREPHWQKSERMYSGTRLVQKDPTRPNVSLEIGFSTVATIVPYITGSVVEPSVEPLSQNATRTRAIVQQAWLSRWVRSTASNFDATLVQATVDSSIYGEGWMLANWAMIEVDNRDEDGIPTGETHTRIEQFNERVSPWDVWCDPMAQSKKRGRFIIQRVLRTREELAEDDRLRIPNINELSSYDPGEDDFDPNRDDETGAKKQVADALDLVELYDFYDLRKRQLITFSLDVSVPLRVVEEVTCPLSPINNHPIPNSPYCYGDLEKIDTLSEAVDHALTKINEHRLGAVEKILSRKGVWTPEAKAAMESTKPRQVVELDLEEGERPSDHLDVYTPSAAAADDYNLVASVRDLADQITGITEYQRGAGPDIRHTATMANLIRDASNAKTAARLRRIEEGVRDNLQIVLDQARDLYPMTEFDEMSLWITVTEAQRVLSTALEEGEEGLVAGFMGLTPEEGASIPLSAVNGMQVAPSEEVFQGRYEVRIHPNSTELQNPTLKAQKYHGIMMTIADLSASGLLDLPNVRLAAEHWLQAEGIDNPADFLSLPVQQEIPAAPAPEPEVPMDITPALAALPEEDIVLEDELAGLEI